MKSSGARSTGKPSTGRSGIRWMKNIFPPSPQAEPPSHRSSASADPPALPTSGPRTTACSRAARSRTAPPLWSRPRPCAPAHAPSSPPRPAMPPARWRPSAPRRGSPRSSLCRHPLRKQNWSRCFCTGRGLSPSMAAMTMPSGSRSPGRRNTADSTATPPTIPSPSRAKKAPDWRYISRTAAVCRR